MLQIRFPKRICLIMSFLQEFKGVVNEENINELLFLYCHKYSANDAYHFIRVNDILSSIQMQEDLKFLRNKSMLDGITPRENLESFFFRLDMFDRAYLRKLKNDFTNGDIANVDEVWNGYFIPNEGRQHASTLFTIGYEGITIEQYVNRLLINNIKILCDVRRNPYSQKQCFSKAALQELLALVGIRYIHIPELGIGSNMRCSLDSDIAYYNLLSKYETEMLPKCTDSIKMLEDLLEKYKNVAITCFESKVSHCHRSKIGKLMKANGYEVSDI